jgi:hypothetical protein
MYGRYKNVAPKSNFIPKSTSGTLKATTSFLKNAQATITPASTVKGAMATTGSGTTDNQASKPTDGTDLFGFGDNEDGDGAGGFWMPEMSIAREPTPRETTQKRNDVGGNGSDVREVFDGYHVWRKYHSQTKNRPFWHCKETGATRWEMPAAGAVQNADKVNNQTSHESLFWMNHPCSRDQSVENLTVYMHIWDELCDQESCKDFACCVTPSSYFARKSASARIPLHSERK